MSAASLATPDYLALRASFEQATGLHRSGNLLEAEALYRSILRTQRRHPEVLHLLGICLHQRGEAEQAVKTLAQALKITPGSAMVHLSLADAQRSLGRSDAALASYQRAAVLAPDSGLALLGKGTMLEGLGRYAEALSVYAQILASDAAHVDAQLGRANCLLLLGRQEEAVQAFDVVLGLRPDHPQAAGNRAVALTQLGQPAEALAGLDALLTLHPDDAAALSNRGNALFALDRFEEALACQDRALALAPTLEGALISRAATLILANRLDEALAAMDRVLAVRPDHADLRRDRAMVLLTQSNFQAGWPEYEWREAGSRRSAAARSKARSEQRGESARRWLGSAGECTEIRGRTIYLYHEQGHGDTIQLLRYVALVRAMGARVILRVQPALQALVRRTLGAQVLVDQGAESWPACDFACPLMSLPYALGTTLATIPSALPYIDADPIRVSRWRSRLGDDPAPRIGLAWSGSAGNPNDRRRSIALARLAPLFAPGLRFLALQPDVRDTDAAAVSGSPALELFGAEIEDFEDTAALIQLCELVICVDTAVAHLAGAMNKPVWVVLPFAPDWRWMLARSDSPWYPSARLFRQSAAGNWDSVIAEVRRALDVQAERLRPQRCAARAERAA